MIAAVATPPVAAGTDADGALPAPSAHRGGRAALHRSRRHWPLLAVVLAFAATAFVVPTLAPVATTDDWGYARPVEILLDDGKLTVFPVVAATAVFHILWGWIFALVFGMSLGVVRVASMAMTALGGIALYALLGDLGLDRGRRALGTAAYLFNPLAFALAYTFMTDPTYTGVMLLATAWYARALRNHEERTRSTVAGSAFAACAFLTRQQGIFLPVAVGCFLLATRRIRPDRPGMALALRVGGLPALAAIGYALWLRYVNDVPAVQTGFVDEARASGLGGSWRLVRNLTYIELVYVGWFTLPIAAALIPALRRVAAGIGTRGWLLFSLAFGALSAGFAVTWAQGKRMPYVGQFVGRGGIGPPDVRGSRPVLLAFGLRTALTIACVLAAVVVALALCRGLAAAAGPERRAAGLVAAVALWQVAGIVPPSFHYLRRGYSLDRYLLPLLPLALCLLLWATRDLDLVRPVAWGLVAVAAVFAIAGTRDYLVYLRTVWSVADAAVATGVAEDQIDAGAAWDGYHLYTEGVARGITTARSPNGPWWVYFYGKATDSSYVVSAKPLSGYSVVAVQPYETWLPQDPSTIYLLRRIAEPAPP